MVFIIIPYWKGCIPYSRKDDSIRNNVSKIYVDSTMKRLRNSLFFTLLCLCFALTGCTTCVDYEDLDGTYQYSVNGMFSSNDAIIIYTSGDYKYLRVYSDKSTFTRIGKWSFNDLTCEILFEDFIFSADKRTFSESKGGNWYSKVKLVDGEVRLMYSMEDNVYFAKSIKRK